MCQMCEGQSRAEVLADLRLRIDRFGWADMSVGADWSAPGFTYTIGLVEYGHPELLVLGRPPYEAGALVNELAALVTDGHGHHFLPGMQFTVRGLEVELVQVDRSNNWLVMAEELYGRAVPALQVVWADADHSFPWQRAETGPERQRVLGSPVSQVPVPRSSPLAHTRN
ncbi:DUF4262 domain-containing protein [Nakamurella silvestris]|nr:DUF4262 domain-containing protein [Nakamurella silvestris]